MLDSLAHEPILPGFRQLARLRALYLYALLPVKNQALNLGIRK